MTLGAPPLRDSGKADELVLESPGLQVGLCGVRACRSPAPRDHHLSGRGRYANDIIQMVESEEELKSFLMKEKEEREKVGLKLNIQQT